MDTNGGRVWKALRQHFLTGLIALLPVAITVYIGVEVLLFFDNVGRLLPTNLQFPGLGLLITVIFITLFGVLVKNIMGQQFVKLLEWFFSRVPILRTIYEGSKQILNAFFDQSGGGQFKSVVFVPYPSQDSKALGFVVNEDVAEGRVGVFVPFSPPTAGYLLFFEEPDVEHVPLTVDDAMKMLLSGGTLVPHRRPGEQGEDGVIAVD